MAYPIKDSDSSQKQLFAAEKQKRSRELKVILSLSAIISCGGLFSFFAFEIGDHHNLIDGFSKIRKAFSVVKLEKNPMDILNQNNKNPQLPKINLDRES